MKMISASSPFLVGTPPSVAQQLGFGGTDAG